MVNEQLIADDATWQQRLKIECGYGLTPSPHRKWLLALRLFIQHDSSRYRHGGSFLFRSVRLIGATGVTDK